MRALRTASVVTLALVTMLALTGGPGEAAQGKPNVLFIMGESYKTYPPLQAPEAYNLDGIIAEIKASKTSSHVGERRYSSGKCCLAHSRGNTPWIPGGVS